MWQNWLALIWVQAAEGWLGTCFVDMPHMAHCCDQPKRCFGQGKDVPNQTAEECCGLNFQTLLINSVAKELRATEDLDTLRQIYAVLQAFLHFVNHGHIYAWELIAQTAGKVALAAYNDFASMANELGEDMFKSQKLLVMREINHAAHLLENFFQAAWYHHAQETGRSAIETDITEVRPKFQNALQIYKVVQEAGSNLIYDQAEAHDPRTFAPRHLAKSPEIVLVVNVVGSWASVGIVTFWSIWRHRSTPLRVFVLGDQQGIREWRLLIKEVKVAVPHFVHKLRFHYVDIFQHPRMTAYFARLPSECASTNMSKALYARMLCHEILPEDVDRAIALDLGDIIVFRDILDLWNQGDLLEADELLAAASHRSAEEAMRQTKPSMLNGGVVLYEVRRMRSSNYTEDTLKAAALGLDKGYQHFCIWDQDQFASIAVRVKVLFMLFCKHPVLLVFLCVNIVNLHFSGYYQCLAARCVGHGRRPSASMSLVHFPNGELAVLLERSQLLAP